MYGKKWVKWDFLAFPIQGVRWGKSDFFYEVVFNEEIGRMNSGGFAVTQQSVQYMASPYIFNTVVAF